MRMTQVQFKVRGRPRPQGSRNWKVPVRDAALDDYRSRISHEAAIAMRGNPATSSPIALTVAFYFRRPKSHYGTGRNAERLKDSSPPSMVQRPDLDKLLRSVLDAMTSIIFEDDQQVTQVIAEKHWSTVIDETVIVVESLGEHLRPRRPR